MFLYVCVCVCVCILCLRWNTQTYKSEFFESQIPRGSQLTIKNGLFHLWREYTHTYVTFLVKKSGQMGEYTCILRATDKKHPEHRGSRTPGEDTVLRIEEQFWAHNVHSQSTRYLDSTISWGVELFSNVCLQPIDHILAHNTKNQWAKHRSQSYKNL